MSIWNFNENWFHEIVFSGGIEIIILRFWFLLRADKYYTINQILWLSCDKQARWSILACNMQLALNWLKRNLRPLKAQNQAIISSKLSLLSLFLCEMEKSCPVPEAVTYWGRDKQVNLRSKQTESNQKCVPLFAFGLKVAVTTAHLSI